MSAALDERWWNAENDDDLAQRIVDAARVVDLATQSRQQWMLDAYCLYGDRSAIDGYDRATDNGGAPITRNLIASAADAVLAEITQTKPRPMFVTIGGDYLDQSRARKLTAFCDAKLDEVKALDLAAQAGRDAIITGLGILRPYIDPQSNKTRVDRIFPPHFLPDDRNAIDVLPRTYYLRHLVDRWHLMECYPDHAEAIESAPGPSQAQWFAESYRTSDVVEVWEAIRLPSRADKSDGRHASVIVGAVLSDAPYERDEPPFAFVRAVKPVRGFWGESLVQRAASTQEELNKLLLRIQSSMHLHAVAQWWVPRQAGVVVGQIVNEVWTIVQYDGPTPPTQMTPASMSSEVYQYVAALEQEVFKLMGVSELSAQSLKPAGVNSGIALNTYNDVQSRRFVSLERDYEALFVELARLIVQLETELAEDDPRREIVYQGPGGRRERIEWSKVALDEDSYRVRVFPASAFPTNPAAKIEMLQGMLDKGTIDQQAFYELALDVPDLESVRNRITAPLELLHKRFAMILEDGEYVGPEPYQDLELGLRECALALQRAEIEEAPEEHIELMRRWFVECEDMIAEATPPAPPMPEALPPEMMPPVDPGMAPEMMPEMPMPPPEMMQ